MIDEIQKITVPTESGNSGTPLNTSQLQLLKTKIMDLQYNGTQYGNFKSKISEWFYSI